MYTEAKLNKGVENVWRGKQDPQFENYLLRITACLSFPSQTLKDASLIGLGYVNAARTRKRLCCFNSLLLLSRGH